MAKCIDCCEPVAFYETRCAPCQTDYAAEMGEKVYAGLTPYAEPAEREVSVCPICEGECRLHRDCPRCAA